MDLTYTISEGYTVTGVGGTYISTPKSKMTIKYENHKVIHTFEDTYQGNKIKAVLELNNPSTTELMLILQLINQIDSLKINPIEYIWVNNLHHQFRYSVV